MGKGIGLGVIVLIAIGAFLFFRNNTFSSLDNTIPSSNPLITIFKGESLSQIDNRLNAENLKRAISEFAFVPKNLR